MMSKNDLPLNRSIIDAVLHEHKLDPESAQIRKVAYTVAEMERRLQCHFLRMEFGIPGFEPNPIGIDAEIEALRRPRVAGEYAPLFGIPSLKQEGARFAKNFLNLTIPPECTIPTVGAMEGTFLALAMAGHLEDNRDTILFIDPNFAVYRTQLRFLGLKEVSVDIFDRENFIGQVENLCKKGNVGGFIYSSPNNPTWAVFTEAECKALGEISQKYGVIAIEDAAYFGMDFRTDYSKPQSPPYPATVARYTDRYVMLVSSSKIFSYAGQRIGLAFVSPYLATAKFSGLKERYGYESFLDAFLWGGLYCVSSGVAQGPQHGLAAYLAKVNDGTFDFLKTVRGYADRAKVLRKILSENGFQEVYKDGHKELVADGFFFTFSYPGLTGGQLLRQLLYYGISTTTLKIYSSCRTEGVRGCSALIPASEFGVFEARIQAFRKDHL